MGLAGGPGDDPELAGPDAVADADAVAATDGPVAAAPVVGPADEALGDGLLGAECICTYAQELALLTGLIDI